MSDVSSSGASDIKPWLRALVENRGYVAEPAVEVGASRSLRNRAALKRRYGPSYWEQFGKADAEAAMRVLQTSLVARACERMFKLLPYPLTLAGELDVQLASHDKATRSHARYAALAGRVIARDLDLRAAGGEGLPPSAVAAAHGDPGDWFDDDEIDLMKPPQRTIKRGKFQRGLYIALDEAGEPVATQVAADDPMIPPAAAAGEERGSGDDCSGDDGDSAASQAADEADEDGDAVSRHADSEEGDDSEWDGGEGDDDSDDEADEEGESAASPASFGSAGEEPPGGSSPEPVEESKSTDSK